MAVTAVAWVWSLAQELPHAAGVAKKFKKRRRRRRQRDQGTIIILGLGQVMFYPPRIKYDIRYTCSSIPIQRVSGLSKELDFWEAKPWNEPNTGPWFQTS